MRWWLVGLGVLMIATAGTLAVVSQPRGIRNNNPGNIRSGDSWRGLSGVDDAGFVIFSGPEWGIRAMTVLIRNYRNLYGIRTIRGIVSRWAPTNENDTGAYISSVSQQTGIGPDQDLSDAQLPQLLAAIIRHENGQQPYSQALIQQGIALA